MTNKFKTKIKEDSIYILKSFKVWEYEKFRPLENNLKINFLFDTTVKEVEEDKTKFLDYYFELQVIISSLRITTRVPLVLGHGTGPCQNDKTNKQTGQNVLHGSRS